MFFLILGLWFFGALFVLWIMRKTPNPTEEWEREHPDIGDPTG